MKSLPRYYFKIIEGLSTIHKRLKNVYIENDDFRKIISRYDSEKTFFYCDLPYITETRKCKKLYKHEMTLDDYKDLVNLLLNIKGTGILSCYYHPVYEPLLEAGWIRKDFEICCQAVGRIKNIKGEGILQNHKRIETLLIKPCNEQSLF